MSGLRPIVRPIVAIDARMVGNTPHGFARYVSFLARGLSEIQHGPASLPYEPVFLVSKEFSSLPEEAQAAFRGRRVEKVAAPFLSPKELTELPKALKRLGAALYHSPSFSSLLTCPCPHVLTVHDLNHLHFGGAREKLYYRMVLRPFARKAARLLSVSRFSAQEIAAWLGIDAGKIGVVYNAIDPGLAQAPDPARVQSVLARYGLERGKFFLSLSNTKPHKNLPLLVAAHRALKGAWPLVLNVRGYESESGVRAVGSVPEADFAALLSGAGVLVFPSLYEGFGLPPLEAAARGVPVIASDIGAHREALQCLPGEEVVFVPPQDRGAWAETLRRAQQGLLHPPSEATRTGIFEQFSPSRLGGDMDRIYRDVLGLGGS